MVISRALTTVVGCIAKIGVLCVKVKLCAV